MTNYNLRLVVIHNDAYASIANTFLVSKLRLKLLSCSTPYICTMYGRCFYLQDGWVCAIVKMNDNIIISSSC